jgi:SAM-dependent methyltransferase
MTAAWRDLLECPVCRAPLDSRMDCAACGYVGGESDGVPLLAPVADDEHKRRQIEFFDEGADEEFEISRPHGLPAFHQWLLGEKFRRSVAGVNLTALRSVLVVCGGSGMDGEFLSGSVDLAVTSDLSLGAARRAAERAHRYDARLVSIVADAESLPFRPASFDMTYVHDGLHHLEDPERAVREMARVAAQAVSITEPAQAVATRMAVAAGVAEDVEEAGNQVRRFTTAELRSWLDSAGFEVVQANRYPMFYRHQPGAPSRLLSLPLLFPIARLGLRGAMRALSLMGNKMTVQAVRR